MAGQRGGRRPQTARDHRDFPSCRALRGRCCRQPFLSARLRIHRPFLDACCNRNGDDGSMATGLPLTETPQDVYGAPGNALGGYSQQALPMLQQFPDRIPPYSPEHGPAFSSQLGLCQDCCRRQATCNPADCAAVGEMNFEQCNDDPSHFADRMLGRVPPNFPDGLNTVSRSKTWSPECPSCGHEWIVVGFPVPIYAEGVMIYEAENPGAVVKISFAETYEGNRTDWTEVWADPMPKALSNTARVFAPSMCTLVGKKTQWVRLDLMTNTSVGWNEIAGLMLFGYESGDLSNWVAHPEGRLFYKQAPGITLSGDVDEFFEVGATDCTGMESEAVKISIPAAEIVRDDTDVFFGPAQPVQAAVGAAAEFEVNIEEARSHLSEALGDEVDEDEFVVVVAPDDGCFHTAEATGALVDNPLNVAGASEPVNCARQLHAKGHSITLAQGPPWGVALHPAHRGVFGGRATVLATARNVTYQLKIVIGVVCPENSSIYECAEGAEACYDEDASLSYDRINRLCRAEEGSDPASKKLVPVLVSCIAVFCLLLVPMVLTCRSYLKKVGLPCRLQAWHFWSPHSSPASFGFLSRLSRSPIARGLRSRGRTSPLSSQASEC